MIALANKDIALIALLVIVQFVMAFRMAGYARQYGYNPRLFFFISLFLTMIPPMLYFWAVYLYRRYQTMGSNVDQLPQFKRRLKHRDQQPGESEGE
jgi:hypothetical protein